MSDSLTLNRPASPCPKCGYDLRGHPDPTRCPECGNLVSVSGAVSAAARWMQHRMLDLWSIGLLQVIGSFGAVVTLMAIRRGHYAALLVGLMAGMCMTTATIWFLAIVPSTIMGKRRPAVLALGGTSRLRLNRWLLWDTLLVAAGVAMATILLR